MQQRHWRWLWIWVGVLMAGCGPIWSSDGNSSPTKDPTVPLLGYTLLPPTLTPPVKPLVTPSPLSITESSLGATPLALPVNGPACYETAVGSLLCLGQVTNASALPIEQVRVAVRLLDSGGATLAVGEAPVSRWLLPTGTAAPYRVLFTSVPKGYAGAHTSIVGGEVAQESDTRYGHLVLREVAGRFVFDQYQVSLSIINKSEAPVGNVSITMTLLDRGGQVTGYRQVLLDPDRVLRPGESLALTLKVVPQGADTVAFDAFAEGEIVLAN